MKGESIVGYFHDDDVDDFDKPKRDQQAYEAEIKRADEGIKKKKKPRVDSEGPTTEADSVTDGGGLSSEEIRYFHSEKSDAEFAADNKELSEREQKRLSEVEEYLKKSLTEKSGELGVGGEKFVEKLKEWWDWMADKNIYDRYLKDTKFGEKLESWEPKNKVAKFLKGATKGFLRNGLGLRTAVTTGLALGTASLVFNPVTFASALMAGDKIALATLFGSRRAFAGLGAGIGTFVGAEKWAQTRRAKKTREIEESLLGEQGDEQEPRMKKDEIEKMTDEQLDDYLADLSYEDREKNSQLIDILIQEKAKRFAWLTDREKSGISEEEAGEMLENWMEGAKGKLEDNFRKAGWSRAGRVALGAGMAAFVASGVGGRIIKGAWHGIFGSGDEAANVAAEGQTGGSSGVEAGAKTPSGSVDVGKVEVVQQVSEAKIGARGAEHYLGQRVDALVTDNDTGVISVLRRQLEAKPEMFGYEEGSGMRVSEWAEKQANKIAFNEEYGSIKVKEPGKVSYILETEKGPDGKIDYHIKRVDYATGKEISADKVGDYEYQESAGNAPVEEPISVETPGAEELPVANPPVTEQPPDHDFFEQQKPEDENLVQKFEGDQPADDLTEQRIGEAAPNPEDNVLAEDTQSPENPLNPILEGRGGSKHEVADSLFTYMDQEEIIPGASQLERKFFAQCIADNPRAVLGQTADPEKIKSLFGAFKVAAENKQLPDFGNNYWHPRTLILGEGGEEQICNVKPLSVRKGFRFGGKTFVTGRSYMVDIDGSGDGNLYTEEEVRDMLNPPKPVGAEAAVEQAGLGAGAGSKIGELSGEDGSALPTEGAPQPEEQPVDAGKRVSLSEIDAEIKRVYMEGHSIFLDLWRNKITGPDQFISRIEDIKGAALTGSERDSWLVRYEEYKSNFLNKNFSGREQFIEDKLLKDIRDNIGHSFDRPEVVTSKKAA